MIQIKVNNKLYSGFESISVDKSMTSIAHTFSATMYNGDELDINGNDLIQILNNGNVFFTGYIDDYNLGIGDKKRPLAIAGRSRTCDLIDCSIAENKQYNNQTPKQIISDLTKDFNIKVYTTLTLDSVDSFDTKIGETYFNCINRLCKQYNILPVSDELGNLKLIKNEKNKISKVVKDKDSKNLDFIQNFTNRFSKYSYKKESIIKDITDGTIEDEEINRFRPFVAVNTEDKENIDMCNWKRNNDKANSINLTIVFDNWDYDINTILKLETEIVNNSFLIKDISYAKDNNGTYSTITLVDKGLFDV